MRVFLLTLICCLSLYTHVCASALPPGDGWEEKGTIARPVGAPEDTDEARYREFDVHKVWRREDGSEYLEPPTRVRVPGRLCRGNDGREETMALGTTYLTPEQLARVKGRVREDGTPDDTPVGAFTVSADGTVWPRLIITADVRAWSSVMVYDVEGLLLYERFPALTVAWKGCSDFTGVRVDESKCAGLSAESGFPEESYRPVIHGAEYDRGTWTPPERVLWIDSYDPRAEPPVMPEGCTLIEEA